MNWENRLQHAAHTDVGMRRFNNQDSHAVKLADDLEAWKDRGHFFMVADGMGAHAAGELASKLAVDGVQHLYYKYSDLSPPDALKKAILETNAEIHRRGQANSDFHNMGTTASTLLLLPQGALIAHIGDSRVYRLRENLLEQLTRDHSLVWELREQLSDKSELAIPKNVITRSLGPNASVQVDIEGPLPVALGDTFLLCSDGLTGRVTDEELASVLGTLPPNEAVHLLIDLANLRGGPDNITVLVAKVVDEELASVVHQPLKVGGERRQVSVQPAIWVCLGVCLLGALLLSDRGDVHPCAGRLSGGHRRSPRGPDLASAEPVVRSRPEWRTTTGKRPVYGNRPCFAGGIRAAAARYHPRASQCQG